MAREARHFRPDLVYCIDLAVVPLAASAIACPTVPLVVDTGDYPSAFLRTVKAGLSQVTAALLMEQFVYRRACAVVVRGQEHARVMRDHGVEAVSVIPDAVDLDLVKPASDPGLRRQLGLADVLTVGIAGHFTWYDRLGGGLGWELVHALELLADVPVHGVLLGAGPGCDRLRELAHRVGVLERLHILGRVPYDEYGRYLSLIDICLLTQTNDPSSSVRTTGKLPGYLAAGRYILASAVGTAATILPESMIVPYAGAWDPTYPTRLAERIRALVADPSLLQEGAGLRGMASAFSYPRAAEQAGRLVDAILDGSD